MMCLLFLEVQGSLPNVVEWELKTGMLNYMNQCPFSALRLDDSMI